MPTVRKYNYYDSYGNIKTTAAGSHPTILIIITAPTIMTFAALDQALPISMVTQQVLPLTM